MLGEDEKGESSDHCCFGTSAGRSPTVCQEKEAALWYKGKAPVHVNVMKRFCNTLSVQGGMKVPFTLAKFLTPPSLPSSPPSSTIVCSNTDSLTWESVGNQTTWRTQVTKSTWLLVFGCMKRYTQAKQQAWCWLNS